MESFMAMEPSDHEDSERFGESGPEKNAWKHTSSSIRTSCHILLKYSPAMLFRFWYMAWCGELGAFTEPLSFWGSWLAVVFMNSIADWRTRNCNATAISLVTQGRDAKGVHVRAPPDAFGGGNAKTLTINQSEAGTLKEKCLLRKGKMKDPPWAYKWRLCKCDYTL